MLEDTPEVLEAYIEGEKQSEAAFRAIAAHHDAATANPGTSRFLRDTDRISAHVGEWLAPNRRHEPKIVLNELRREQLACGTAEG